MITQTISDLGDAPSSKSPGDFDNKADNFLENMETLDDELNTWATQANALAADVNQDATDAEGAKDTAMAAANFKGNWSSLSGALNVPASVLHSGTYWMLLNNLANVASSEPGVTGDWSELTVVSFPLERKTISFTAASNTRYKCDNAITITLPASPSDGDRIWLSPLEDMTASNATVARNGKLLMGLAENMTWDVNQPINLVYDSADGDWRFM